MPDRNCRFVLRRWIVAAAFALSVAGGTLRAATDTNGFRLADLKPFAGSFAPYANSKPLRALPAGTQTFHGIPFSIGAAIAVTGMMPARDGEFFPPEITGIEVGARVSRVHLLHGTIADEKDGIPMAKVVFRYADGTAESVRLGYGIHARDWSTPRGERSTELLDPNSRLAWAEASDRRGTGLRLFQTALENPKPSVAVERLDIVSLFSRAAPLVFAITAETPEAKTTAPAPSGPPRKLIRELTQLPDSAYRREVTFRVRDGETSRAATNALAVLALTDDKESFYFGEARTDPEGICRFVYPPQYAVALTFWAHAPGRMPALVGDSTTTNRHAFYSEYTAELKRGTTAGGIVLDAANRPIANAEIIVYQVARSGTRHFRRTDFDSARAGSDGKWQSSSLPTELTGLVFQVFHPDFRPALYATPGYTPPPTDLPASSSTSSTVIRRLGDGTMMTMNSPGARRMPAIALLDTNALLAGTAEVKLQPAPLLEGSLVDAGNNPVPNTEVILLRSLTQRSFLRTDAQGRFRARITDPGAVDLVVVQSGSNPLWRKVAVMTNTTVALQLAPARTVTGLVRERNQRPVPGAVVRLEEWNGTTDLLRFETVTDEEGRFTWTGAPLDRAMLSVSKTNYTTSRTSFSGIANNLTMTLSRPYGVYGRAFDADTGQPIPLFTVMPGRKYSTDDPQIHWERSEGTVGRDGEYSLRMSSYYFQPEARVLIEAPGYLPQMSPPFRNYDAYTNDFRLKKGKGVEGLVKLPDGSPAVGATLVLAEKGSSASMDLAGNLRGSGADMSRSDTRGRFEFAAKLNPDKIYASHPAGFAEIAVSEVQNGREIQLQPWATIRGVLRVGEKVEPNQSVRLMNVYSVQSTPEGRPAYFYMSVRVEPDADGNFTFARVPPGEFRVGLEYRFRESNYGETPFSHALPVTAKPGETAQVTIGGTGRRIIGRVNLSGGEHSDVDWMRDVQRLTLMVPPMRAPLANAVMRAPDFSDRQRAERSYVLVMSSNGTFHADHIPPGQYTLTLKVTDPEDEYYNYRPIGTTNIQVTVPAEATAKVNAPLDVGVVNLAIRPRVKVGSVVTSFEMPTLDGKKFQLSDFRGKHVLLHFWGRSMGWSSSDFETLKELHAAHGSGGKLVIIGCNLDPDGNSDSVRQFVKSQGLIWPQAYLGYWYESPIAGMFGLQGSSGCALIDPEGKLLASQLRGSTVRSAVAVALGGADGE